MAMDSKTNCRWCFSATQPGMFIYSRQAKIGVGEQCLKVIPAVEANKKMGEAKASYSK